MLHCQPDPRCFRSLFSLFVQFRQVFLTVFSALQIVKFSNTLTDANRQVLLSNQEHIHEYSKKCNSTANGFLYYYISSRGGAIRCSTDVRPE